MRCRATQGPPSRSRLSAWVAMETAGRQLCLAPVSAQAPKHTPLQPRKGGARARAGWGRGWRRRWIWGHPSMHGFPILECLFSPSYNNQQLALIWPSRKLPSAGQWVHSQPPPSNSPPPTPHSRGHPPRSPPHTHCPAPWPSALHTRPSAAGPSQPQRPRLPPPLPLLGCPQRWR